MNKFVTFTFLALWLPIGLYAQFSIFEDSSGKSSIVSPLGYVGVNTQNKSVRFQYFYLKSSGPQSSNHVFFGFGVSGKLENDLSTFLSSGKMTTASEIDFNIGKRYLLFKCPDDGINHGVAISDWIKIRLEMDAAEYNLFNQDKNFEEQIAQKTYHGFSTILSYNVNYAGDYLFGIAIGAETYNNIPYLKNSVMTQTRIFSDTNSGTTREIKKEISVFEGSYKAGKRFPFNIDIVRFISKGTPEIIALNLYMRYFFQEGKNLAKAGIGCYFIGKSSGKIIGGLFAENIDLGNAYSNESDFWKRVRIGFTLNMLIWNPPI